MEFRSSETGNLLGWKDGEFPLAVLLLSIYLAFVLRIGPTFMKNRPAYKLTGTLLVYNAMQVLISLYLVKICLREILESGLLPRKCYMFIEEHWNLVSVIRIERRL
ncbi:uncharacterized protein LOC133519620 [Cydia pomonella]|uniref:uncharacterized protein LOC133519620 n=1 Tax=Cydia pomonella TaxID=82600 RepID=UPI002ADD991D|nr:uncharacterized protein LOC133519620 [Cydia pomonella]